MDAMPPAGSLRRRAAVGFALLMAAVWAYVLMHGLVALITKGGSFALIVMLVMVALNGVVVGALLLQEGRKQLEREP